METRALHIFWRQALAAPERLLGDLARHTDINVLIVDAAYLGADVPADATVLARAYCDRYIVPSTAPFGGLPVSVAGEAEYAATFGFMDLARGRGFAISCHVLPLSPNSPGMARTACVGVTGHPALDEAMTGPGPPGGLQFAHACPNNPEA